MGSRHFANKFRNYNESIAKNYLDDSLSGLSETFSNKIIAYESAKFGKLTTDYAGEIFSSSCVFTGSAGIAYLFYLNSKVDSNKNISSLLEAVKYVQIKNSRNPRVTFLCGEAGPLALGLAIGDRLGSNRPPQLQEPAALAQRLESLWAVAQLSTTPDELLYGRTGYLYSLLFVNKETGKKYISPLLITQVIEAILASGHQLASQPGMDWETPLLFEWHESFYLGAAHGTVGILYMLLQAREYLKREQFEEYIQPTLEWLLSLCYEGGNLPSSIGSSSDRLVQWCHGAPGFVQLCCLAYQIMEDKKYLDAALKCGEVVWVRGLCTKGYSICHGVAGNAYTFLQLYQITKDPVHLYRACCFADYCMEEKSGTEQHKPDAPASLFEGLAGRLFLMADIKNPKTAKFPGYTL